MSAKVLSRLSAGFLVFCLLAVAIAAATLLLARDTVDLTVNEGDAQIFFSVHYLVNTGCADATWKVEHIRSVSLNGIGQVGEGQQQICGEEPVLQVELQDGSLHTYMAKRIDTLSLQRWLLLAFVSAVAGFTLRWEGRSGIASASGQFRRFPMIILPLMLLGLFALALTLPDWPTFQTWMAALPLASQGAPSLTHILLIAFTTTLVYWLLFPAALRPTAVLVMSAVLFIFEGATLELLALIVLLSHTVQMIAADPPPPPESSAAKPNPALIAVSLILVGILLLYFALASQIPQASPKLIVLLGILVILAFVLVRPPIQWGWLFPNQPSIPPQRISGLAWGVGIIVLFFVAAAMMTSLTSDVDSLLTLVPRLILLPLLAAAGIALYILHQRLSKSARLRIGRIIIVYLLLVFILLKSSLGVSLGIVGWIGFSYITFRLLHVLFERLNNRETGNATPAEMLLYVIFFPAILIGPIDRLPRFLSDLRGESVTFQWSKINEGVIRIIIGGIKKFLLADLLFSQLALNGALQPDIGIVFAWTQLYVSAFYLFLDFSGFTDIAIGMGLLLGYSLPDNFNNPYSKNNLAQFWQSWHITLSSWLRTYIFLPLSRSLLRTRLGHYPSLVVFCTQMVTMLSIGLWHGITFNFAIWGAWHGFGLFVQKIFADNTRRRQIRLKQNQFTALLMNGAGLFLTFHFVVLGWVFFMLNTPAESIEFFMRLIGR